MKRSPTEEKLEQLALENIIAKARHYGLWKHLLSIRLTLVDRIFFRAHAHLAEAVDELVDDGYFQPALTASSHRKIYDVFQTVPATPLRSFREVKRPSLQIVYARDHDAQLACEMDIDLANPRMDLVGFFVHLFEVLVPGKTDHRRIRAALLKDPDTRRYL